MIGLAIGKLFDFLSKLSGKKFSISAIRVQKFCADSVYSSSIGETGFVPPVSLNEALDRTLSYEFKDM